jgi:hypothetical protein
LPHSTRLQRNLLFCGLSSHARFPSLPEYSYQRKHKQPCRYAFGPCYEYVPPVRAGMALLCILVGLYFAR